MSHNRRYENARDPINPVGKSDTEGCDLCGRKVDLEQDHDHRTDLCRGQLCSSCNHLVGRFDRPIEEIDRFLAYLRHWADVHATIGAQSYTDYMQAMFPRYGKRGRGRWQRKPEEAA